MHKKIKGKVKLLLNRVMYYTHSSTLNFIVCNGKILPSKIMH
jgi:hypothetical protein